ncbi:ribonuclease inhibitor-like [Neoarius graeffei]|uniref:ribonuclease inhibitor-like n=1 Tax=Neoarius graeffei TaxID=443677 RepID=UPI00298CB6E5|nr:ribonuclease inhibitor-like [Neoarius graeffei]
MQLMLISVRVNFSPHRLLKSPEAEEVCGRLTKVLETNPLLQTHLNLRGKIKGDSEVEQLSALLKDPHCRAEKLTLTECNLMMESCKALAEVLSSHRFLTELDLSKNGLQNSGVQQLSEGLKNQSCILKILRLTECNLMMESCKALAEVLSSHRFLTELDLSENGLQNSGVQQLSEGLKNQSCILEILRYSNISLYKQCRAISSDINLKAISC